MLAWLLLAGLSGSVAAEVDPREIVRRCVAADARNWQRAGNYQFLQRSRTSRLDGQGRIKSVDLSTYEVILLDGVPHPRLVMRDDRPLPPEEDRRQRERLRQRLEEYRRLSPEERRRRMNVAEQERERHRVAIREIPEAFDFQFLGEETIGARRTYVIGGRPRAGYRPRERLAKLFPRVRGKLWIDQRDYGWVRLEAELVDSVWFGWILLRLAKGGQVRIEQAPVEDEVWFPQRLWFMISARIGLLKTYNLEQEMTFRDYRKLDPRWPAASLPGAR